jgi:ribosomal protein S18 acetylase RimI-like enzyme
VATARGRVGLTSTGGAAVRIGHQALHHRRSGKLLGVRVSDIERITAFENRFAQAQATDVVNLSFGFAVLQKEFPLSEYHNRIAVTSAAPAAEVLATAEEVLGGACMRHRYLSVDDALVQALSADFVAAGYEHEIIVTLKYSGPEVEPAAHEVRAVSLETLRPAIIRDWRVELPDATEENLGQLADRTALYTRGAELTRLAVYNGDEIVAHADLYVDRVDRIAQFENLVTHKDFRGRGYGDALIRDALRRGREAGSELSFLTADLNDWPREWYQRLGYVDAGRTHHFSRRE